MKFFLSIIFLSITVCLKSQCPEGLITSKQNLVINGDFENGNKHFKSHYKHYFQAGPGRYNIIKDAKKYSPQFFIGTGDNYYMAVDGAIGANMTVWEQQIKVEPNTIYFFSAWVNTLNIRTGPPAVLQFSINSKPIGETFNCPNKLNVWKQFFVNWTSAEDTTATIRIVSQNRDEHGNDFGLDRIKFYQCLQPDFDKKLKEAKLGETIELRNIFFETGKSELMEGSYVQLNKLVAYLKENSKVEIEIAGHTDNIGTNESNMKLSAGRANAVAKFLMAKGIEKSRFRAVGYGESHPKESNETLEGRQINRRVEFKIVCK